jgi:hypothetical protein
MQHTKASHYRNMNMSSRLSKTIASLHMSRSVDLKRAYIGAQGAVTLADALANNASVTSIDLESNRIGYKGA